MLKVLICKYALLVSLKLLSGDRESSGRFWTQEVTEERTTKVREKGLIQMKADTHTLVKMKIHRERKLNISIRRPP